MRVKHARGYNEQVSSVYLRRAGDLADIVRTVSYLR